MTAPDMCGYVEEQDSENDIRVRRGRPPFGVDLGGPPSGVGIRDGHDGTASLEFPAPLGRRDRAHRDAMRLSVKVTVRERTVATRNLCVLRLSGRPVERLGERYQLKFGPARPRCPLRGAPRPPR